MKCQNLEHLPGHNSSFRKRSFLDSTSKDSRRKEKDMDEEMVSIGTLSSGSSTLLASSACLKNPKCFLDPDTISIYMFEQFQIDALEVAFQGSGHLSRERKCELVNQTGLDVEQVTSWFNRRRKRERERKTRKMSERRNLELEQLLQESREREAKLRLEVEESRRREIELRNEIQNLRLQMGSFGGNDPIPIPFPRFVNGYE